MFIRNILKILSLFFFTSFFIVGLQPQSAWSLTVGETYTIDLYKVNSNGTKTQVSSTTATADSDGKISFSLTNVPTSPSTNFIVMTVTDSGGSVVRKGFAPAPPSDSTNLTGINNVSTSQTDAILQCGTLTGTDDPILVAYGLVLTRSPDISSSDIEGIATLGNAAIRGSGGFESFLTSNGVTADQLSDLKEKLVYNAASGARDLSDFTAKFKTAVDSDSDDEMSKAGGYMAEIFVDAATAANIDLGLILAAHDAAGEVTFQAEYVQLISSMSSGVQKAMEQSMSSFFTRIAAMKIEADYTSALTTLQASGSQVTNYNTAVQTMITAFENIDATYAEYFMDPDTYVANNSTTHNAVQQAIGTAFNNAFTQFQTDIASSNQEITDLKTTVASALGINVGDLPADFGTARDFSNNTVNWPIPQAVMVGWVASILSAGGELTYTRWTAGELAVPGNMGWLNGNTGTREDFTDDGMPASFAAMMGLQEDIMIIEFTRYKIFDDFDQNTSNEDMRNGEKTARLAFQQNLDATIDKIGGTVDGSTAIGTAQKKAMILLIQQPSLH